MVRKKNNSLEQQIKSISAETNNPAIISDVINSEISVMPANIPRNEVNYLNDFEKSIVRNSVDGKTWNSIDENK